MRRALNQSWVESGTAAAARFDADAGIAVQESGQEWTAHLERRPGNVARLLARRQRWPGRGHTQVGHRQRHQFVRHLRGALRDGNWKNLAAHWLEAYKLCDHHQGLLEHQVSGGAGVVYTLFLLSISFDSPNRSEERGLSRKHIIECVRASLQRLQLNYIDIVIIHKADPMCPMEGGYSDPIGRGLVSLTSAERIPDHVQHLWNLFSSRLPLRLLNYPVHTIIYSSIHLLIFPVNYLLN